MHYWSSISITVCSDGRASMGYQPREINKVRSLSEGGREFLLTTSLAQISWKIRPRPKNPHTEPATAYHLVRVLNMCESYKRVYTCGHYKTSTTYCTKQRYKDRDACNPPKKETASGTGSYCGWKGCDKKPNLERDPPKGKPDVSHIIYFHRPLIDSRMLTLTIYLMSERETRNLGRD